MKIYKIKKHKGNKNRENNSPQLPSEMQERGVFLTIDENFSFLKSIFGDGIGLVVAKYAVFEDRVQIGVAYIESIIDTKLLSSQVIEPLLRETDFKFGSSKNVFKVIQAKLISVPNLKQSNKMKEVLSALLNGKTLLFSEGLENALIIGTRKVEKRAVEKPDNEVTVSAANDAFVEDLDTNCSLIIRRLPTPNLHFASFTVGQLSNTKVKLIWLEGIAKKEIIQEAKRRIENIDIDAVEGIGVLAELIQDRPISLFPKYKQTQRPDTTSRYLTEGHFAILCSNSPFALIAPVSFWDNFKTMDDYSEPPIIASYLRSIRVFAFILAILISPLYLSFVTYNHTIVPPPLAINIAMGREGVPFPSVVELLILSVSITIIREASLRISGSVGFFIGTISAVVIGQATVNAGYVSASVIIVVAISAISSFAISTTTLVFPARILNYLLILMASVFGMFGLFNGIVILLWYLLSLESFGVPYLYPLVPFDLEGMKDTIIRAPYIHLKKRLGLLAPENLSKLK